MSITDVEIPMKHRNAALIAICVALFGLSGHEVLAQAPLGATSTNASSTIAVTNTFQSVFAANTNFNRTGCALQNNGTHAMYVFFGPIASATLGKSVNLAPGQPVSCNSAPVTLNDQVSITGTSGDAFFAAVQ